VSDKKEIVIKDACILFDLVDLNLLEDFFQLDVSAFTTPQVIGEITNEMHWEEVLKFINKGNLQIDANGNFEVIAGIYDEHAGLSIPDSSVLELAIRKDAVIFSSDGSLRKISVKKNLTVRGVLWIIEELHYRKFLSKEMAIQKLNLYEEINQRAPIKEINKLLDKLNNV
jgi:predicted nucleic acid-binding protein